MESESAAPLISESDPFPDPHELVGALGFSGWHAGS